MQTNVHIDTKNLRPSPEHHPKGSFAQRALEVSVKDFPRHRNATQKNSKLELFRVSARAFRILMPAFGSFLQPELFTIRPFRYEPSRQNCFYFVRCFLHCFRAKNRTKVHEIVRNFPYSSRFSARKRLVFQCRSHCLIGFQLNSHAVRQI